MTEAPKTPPPPPSSSPPPPPPPTPTEQSTTQVGGLDVNVAAALSYFPIIAIVWLVLEPYNKNRFIRFHAIQAIGLAVISMGINVVLTMIPFLGWIILPFFSLAMFALFVVSAVKAFQGTEFKLPVVGDFADKQAGPK